MQLPEMHTRTVQCRFHQYLQLRRMCIARMVFVKGYTFSVLPDGDGANFSSCFYAKYIRHRAAKV
jgi:hypothetical protein